MSDPWWNGARWWKADFHAHTPASDDYGKGPQQKALQNLAPSDWLLAYMKARVDCVAVTDHNTGEWVDRLVSALNDLDGQQPADYRPLTIFPGVEISTHGGVHVLAVFDVGVTTAQIASLLAKVGFNGTPGRSDAVTDKTVVEVVREVHKAQGIAIPAHADEPRGLFKEMEGQTLNSVLGCKLIIAMELNATGYLKPRLYEEQKLAWTEVAGSDAHHPTADLSDRYPGSRFTWVKMSEPRLDGLKLALLDGSPSVKRYDRVSGDPNQQHAPLVLESFKVKQARYMGRPDALVVDLNPWLNAIIGGRGTGKSTFIEFLRLVLRRDHEIPKDLKSDFEKYAKVPESREDQGLLTRETALEAIYRKDRTRFMLRWTPAGDEGSIFEQQEDGSWDPVPGDVSQRFPARIYSQKQIFQLAKEPGALLQVVDDAQEVDHRGWSEQWEEEKTRFLSLRAKRRELEASLAVESRLRGELDDIRRKLAVFENTGHADVLRTYQLRRRQQRAVESWEESWAGVGARIRQLAGEILPDPLEDAALDEMAAEDTALQRLAEEARGGLDKVRESLGDLAASADAIVAEWSHERGLSAWMQRVSAALQAYADLKQKLATESVGDPGAYGELVQSRQAAELRLQTIADQRKRIEEIKKQTEQSLGRLSRLRSKLTRARAEFLEQVLADNLYVRISVVAYGAKEAAEAEIRKILGRESGGFEKDIGEPGGDGLLGRLYETSDRPAEIEARLADLKRDARAIAEGQSDAPNVRDQRFAAHLAKLRPEALDHLDLWFPEDSLEVQYSTTGDGRKLRSIQEGSPGQKTAALLAFLLSYGKEPLILDQPEDDLDNHLIYDLIVKQLRDAKQDRQLIVVTHNANIVVNGDAELVVAFEPQRGVTRVECKGSLQDSEVRRTICAVMEGGREAFDSRYQRITMAALEDRNV